MMERIGSTVLMVHAERLENGHFFICGMEDGRAVSEDSILRRMLFAWHEKSFYGTQLEAGKQGNQEGLLLSPLMALHYFASPKPLLHLKLEWPPELELLKSIAGVFRDALDRGWFVPSYEAWRAGGIGWKLHLPEEAGERYEELKRLAANNGIRYADEWFSQAMNEMLLDEPGVQSAWSRICGEAALLQAHANGFAEPQDVPEWMDEEAWLEAIGWKRDAAPMRTCLRLIEPEPELEEHTWRLQIILQDKADPRIQMACNTKGEPEAGSIPDVWRDYASQRLHRDLSRWLNILPGLHKPDGSLRTELNETEALDFMQEGSMKLLQAGYSVFLPSWWEELRKLQPKLKARLKSSVGSGQQTFFGADAMMSFDWRIAIGGLELSEEEFLRIAEEKKRLLYIRGRWIQLDPSFIAQVQQEMKRVEKQQGLSFREILELHLLGQSEDGELSGDAADADARAIAPDRPLRIEVELNRHLTKLVDQLQQKERIPIQEPPAGLNASLRRYQQEGVAWLQFMRQFGLGCCLADDMGLGKTIQFIAYLLHIKEKGPASSGAPGSPALLICPTSVLGNWQKELERFAPSLRVHLHYGPQRAKGEAWAESIEGCDLVITSYNLAQLDEEDLASVTWECIGLDEAQNIKNAYTKQSAAIRRLQARHRIALTGTPIENRLTELWSIFDFINPGYLGSLGQFTHKFVNPIEKSGDDTLVAQVQKLIRPFLLRRVKKDPAIQLDLPDKNESKAYVTLTVEQATLYENVVKELMDRIDSLTGIERKGLVLATLTKLKQICDHPALFLKDSAAAGEPESSSKVTRLLEMVAELREEGDSCLIFTQFVEMGHLLERTLSRERSEPVQFLHGGVPKKQRDAMIERFQDTSLLAQERCPIFILSLRAGGTGLNLTAANHVFHFDRWWNPAVENQATDRAFRIGQKRDVQVHKFITLGTLEERIDEMIERKQGLSQQIVGSGENWVTEMSTSELRELFALRKEWIGK